MNEEVCLNGVCFPWQDVPFAYRFVSCPVFFSLDFEIPPKTVFFFWKLTPTPFFLAIVAGLNSETKFQKFLFFLIVFSLLIEVIGTWVLEQNFFR